MVIFLLNLWFWEAVSLVIIVHFRGCEFLGGEIPLNEYNGGL